MIRDIEIARDRGRTCFLLVRRSWRESACWILVFGASPDAGVAGAERSNSSSGSSHRSPPECELPRCAETVCQEIQGPALIRLCGFGHQRARALGPLAASPPFHGKAYFAVGAAGFLVGHDHIFALRQHADAPIAEPAAFASDLLHLLADPGMVKRAFAPDRLWIDADKPADLAMRDIMIPHCIGRCLSPLFRCRQLSSGKSFESTLSSIISASSRFSLAFLSSSAFSRAASDISMPPYLDFSL